MKSIGLTLSFVSMESCEVTVHLLSLPRDSAFQIISVCKGANLGLGIVGGIDRNEGPLVYIQEIIPGGDCHKVGKNLSFSHCWVPCIFACILYTNRHHTHTLSLWNSFLFLPGQNYLIAPQHGCLVMKIM